jgi:hypothetical protein
VTVSYFNLLEGHGEEPEMNLASERERKREGKKGRERVVGKAAGDECVFYTRRRVEAGR